MRGFFALHFPNKSPSVLLLKLTTNSKKVTLCRIVDLQLQHGCEVKIQCKLTDQLAVQHARVTEWQLCLKGSTAVQCAEC